MATSQVPKTPTIVPEAVLGAGAPVRVEAPASKQQDVSKLAAGAGVALGGRIIGRGLLLGVDVALARLLGPVQYGLYVIGWTITRLATMLAPMGLNAGVIRFGALHWKRDDAQLKGVLWVCLGVSALIALTMGVALFFAAPWLAGSVYHKPELVNSFRWFALGFPSAAIVTVAAAATRITQRVKNGVLIEDLSQPAVALFLIFVLVGVLKQGMQGALIAYLVSFVGSSLLGIYYVAKMFPASVPGKI